jgi:hypothetical protein
MSIINLSLLKYLNFKKMIILMLKKTIQSLPSASANKDEDDEDSSEKNSQRKRRRVIRI